MNRWLPSAGALAVVLVLLGAMYLLRQEPARTPEATQQAEPPPLPMHVLLDAGDTQPELISIDCGGETAEYAFDQEQGAYAAVGDDRRLAFDQDALGRLFDSCSRLVSRKIIDEKPEDLSVYGLYEPMSTVSIAYPDGESSEILVGPRSQLADGYFGKLAGDPAE